MVIISVDTLSVEKCFKVFILSICSHGSSEKVKMQSQSLHEVGGNIGKLLLKQHQQQLCPANWPKNCS